MATIVLAPYLTLHPGADLFINILAADPKQGSLPCGEEVDGDQPVMGC